MSQSQCKPHLHPRKHLKGAATRERHIIFETQNSKRTPSLNPDRHQTMNISSPFPSLTSRPPSSSSLGSSEIVGTLFLGLAFVLGFPGNLFVVWTVLCRVARRSVTCLLVLNLAAADALVLLSAPFFIRYLVGGRGWEFGSSFCKLVHYLCSVNMYASIFLIAAMSLDRFLAVSRPFLSQQLRTKRALLKILLLIWSLAFLFAIPMPFYRRLVFQPRLRLS
ncbi:leukotriene B4 receptor 1-like [Acipenser ruthenus]|uniref:leukotriene B4 receptor 1-like n=1 Tax=Acipenser ruthenus TaxID=7906 RepID=UPI0015619E01|nr:leukotriene B4 receptor 1-like [Acipenser ruthenus]